MLRWFGRTHLKCMRRSEHNWSNIELLGANLPRVSADDQNNILRVLFWSTLAIRESHIAPVVASALDFNRGFRFV